MKRIDTATVDADKFGTGRDGFTNGDPGVPTPPTQLDDTWFDHVQEEIARSVEGDGTTLDDTNYNQLDDAVQRAAVRGVCTSPTVDYVLRGLTFTLNGASLTIPLAAGEFVQDGRRYVVTAAKLADASADSFVLPASRDTYFFIASEDPGTPTGDRETVYVTTSDVANGAAAPATPAGTLLFAMVVSNGSGSTAVTYYNRGPRLAEEIGSFVALRPVVGSEATRACLHPSPAVAVDLGYAVADSVEGHYDDAYLKRIRLKSSRSSLYSNFENDRYTGLAVSAAGVNENVTILDASLYPDGTSVYVQVKAVAFDPSDPTDGYSGRVECHAHIDGGGTWQLDGSGSAPQFEDGNGAIAAGVTISYNVSGSLLRLQLTAHATDTLRWVYEVHVITAGD